MSGAFGGNMSGPTRNNKKGMFENAYIRNQIVKPYLSSQNADRMGQYPLPDVDNLDIPSNWKYQIQDVMKAEGYRDSSPWFYKGAKMCLVWPVWNYAFPDAKWIIVRRKTTDIINSCMRTGFMSRFNSTQFQKAVGANNAEEGWYWWVKQHEARFAEMIMAGLNVKQVWPERMVEGNYAQMKEMLEWLGLKPNLTQIMEFIEPKLWKARHKLDFVQNGN